MDYEYTANGKTVVLETDDDLVAVRFREPAPHSRRAAMAARPELSAYSERFEVPGGEKFTIFRVAQTAQPRAERFRAAADSLAVEADVARVAPVFKVGTSHALATDRILVGFAPDIVNATSVIQEHGGTVLEQNGDEYLVQLNESADPFAVVEQLDALDTVEYAEPDFVTIGTHTPRQSAPSPTTSDDPLADQQYAIAITQAIDAWKLQSGDAYIKIAILDEGVDTNHEDLAAVIVGEYDASDDDTFQEPNAWDAHGTACAGLAAAIHANKMGVKGIGGGCSLLAVRIAFSETPGEPWVTSHSWIRRAIDWSWRNGADILSNSWGGGLPSTAIARAFARARTRGRNGKGCVVVIAAGNDSGPVNFPANLDGVLAVSASNEFDEFKTTTSQDDEWWWGSSFGPEIDVAAPGVHNYTTDITGEAGYNTAIDGHYVPDFNGTSSATPIVAGALGLMLSANEQLTESQARQIIRDTADKVGALPYVNGRNDQMGYGRLNVRKAVQAAIALRSSHHPVDQQTISTNGDGYQESVIAATPSRIALRESWRRWVTHPYANVSPTADEHIVQLDAVAEPLDDSGEPTLQVRRSATRLIDEDPDQLRRFVDAVVQLKHKRREPNGPSIYDEFVALHLGVVGLRWSADALGLTDPSSLEGLAMGPAAGVDGGHGGPAFLPWHREYLHRFEHELQQIDPGVTIPYWDWTDHQGTQRLFTPEFMGPNGTRSGSAGFPVLDGHFAGSSFPVMPELHYRPLARPVLENLGRTLQRDFMPGGVGPNGNIAYCDLARPAEVLLALQQFEYESFRSQLEGGDRLHGFGHIWIGRSMAIMSSPNDPIFWLHHANVDRIWAEWQARRKQEWELQNPAQEYAYMMHYVQGPVNPGHGLTDPMWPWDGGATTPARYIPGQELFDASGVNLYDWLFAARALPDGFALPDFGGHVRTPGDVLDPQEQLNYTYDTLSETPAPTRINIPLQQKKHFATVVVRPDTVVA